MKSNLNWQQKLQAAAQQNVPVAIVAQPRSDDAAIAVQLRAAATRWAVRRDGFAEGKSLTCLDMAAKVERFGSFASDKQRDYARKLVEWSKPRTGAPAAIDTTTARLPKLFAVMQKHAHFYAEPLKLSRKNQDSLCWIMFKGQCVGKIENAVLTTFDRRLGADKDAVLSLLSEFERDPLEAAKKYGKLSGRCCSCGADLTDPKSIAAGIGPICANKFN